MLQDQKAGKPAATAGWHARWLPSASRNAKDPELAQLLQKVGLVRADSAPKESGHAGSSFAAQDGREEHKTVIMARCIQTACRLDV